MHCSTNVLPNFCSTVKIGGPGELHLSTAGCCDALPSQDFYQKECWAHHPKPHQEYMDMRKKQVSRGSCPQKAACRGEHRTCNAWLTCRLNLTAPTRPSPPRQTGRSNGG